METQTNTQDTNKPIKSPIPSRLNLRTVIDLPRSEFPKIIQKKEEIKKRNSLSDRNSWDDKRNSLEFRYVPEGMKTNDMVKAALDKTGL